MGNFKEFDYVMLLRGMPPNFKSSYMFFPNSFNSIFFSRENNGLAFILIYTQHTAPVTILNKERRQTKCINYCYNSLFSGGSSFCIMGKSVFAVNYRLQGWQDISEFLTWVVSPNYLILSKCFFLCVCMCV